MENKILRFAVIGCGLMGLRRMQIVSNNPKSSLIFAVDKNINIKSEINRRFKCTFYTDYKKALKENIIDCVIISVPNKFHSEIACFFLSKKIHVWCEKPLARNPKEASDMVDIANKNNVYLKTGGNLRYFPNVNEAKQLIDRGEIGDIYYIRGWVGHSGWTQGAWYSDRELSGGGTFLDNGSHLFDLVRWFCGEVKYGFGAVRNYHWPLKSVEDNGFGIFETVKNQIAFIQASWTEWKGYMYMEIYGRKGFVYIKNRGNICSLKIGDTKGDRKLIKYPKTAKTSHHFEVESFIDSVLKNNQPLPSGFDGLRSVEMAYAIYKSSKTGKKIKI